MKTGLKQVSEICWT